MGRKESNQTKQIPICPSKFLNTKCITGIFPRPDFGLDIDPFPIKKWAKTSQNDAYHSQFPNSTI